MTQSPTPEQLLAVAQPQSAAAMRQALEWTAAALQGISDGISERSLFTIDGTKKTLKQILDEADAALGAPSEQPQQDAEPVAQIMWEAVKATFEQRPGHMQLIAAAVRASLNVAPPPQQPAQQQDARDGARWRKLMMKVCAYGNPLDGYRFDLINLPRPISNPMKGSVSQHFEAAIDAMTAAQGKTEQEDEVEVQCPGCGKHGAPDGKDGEYHCGSGLSGGCTR